MVDAKSDGDRQRKLELLQKGYDEVLDAVKHQDDKIGRLLTGLSFLTAATLAVSSLGGAKYATRRFRVGYLGDLPLALIFLGIFVGGVVVAVSLLLGAFSTPLRIPGQRRPKGKGFKSTIFFFDIAGQSLEDWTKRLERESVASLEAGRVQEFVHETHNLAARAKYKHDRVSEATMIIVTAMLPLVLAAVLTIVAAADQSVCVATNGADECKLPPLAISQTTALIIGALVAAAILVQYHVVIRNQRQTQEDRKTASKGDGWVAGCTAFVAGCLAAVVPAWDWQVPALLVAGFIAVYVQANRLPRRSKSTRITLAVTAAVALLAVIAAGYGDYGVRLFAGVAIYGVLSLSDLVRSLLRARSEGKTPEEAVREDPVPAYIDDQGAGIGSSAGSDAATDLPPLGARFVVSVGRVTIVGWDRKSSD